MPDSVAPPANGLRIEAVSKSFRAARGGATPLQALERVFTDLVERLWREIEAEAYQAMVAG